MASNNTAPTLLELDSLPRRGRHQRLAKFMCSTQSAALTLHGLSGLGWRSADVAFCVSHRVDWALEVLTSVHKPLLLLDCRIEKAALRAVGRRWGKLAQAPELLDELNARCAHTTAVKTHPLLRLFDTLTPVGRGDMLKTLIKNGPSDGRADVRVQAYDEILSSVPSSEVIASRLQSLLPVCSQGTMVGFLERLGSAELSMISARTWKQMTVNRSCILERWALEKVTKAPNALVSAFCASCSKAKGGMDGDSGAGVLQTRGQQFFHRFYTSTDRRDCNSWPNFLSASGLTRGKTSSKTQAQRAAALFLFRGHQEKLDLEGMEDTKSETLVTIAKWLLEHSGAQGDVDLAVRAIRRISRPHCSYIGRSTLRVPPGFGEFELRDRPFVLAHASSSALRSDQPDVWDAFLDVLPAGTQVDSGVLTQLDRESASSLLAKVGGVPAINKGNWWKLSFVNPRYAILEHGGYIDSLLSVVLSNAWKVDKEQEEHEHAVAAMILDQLLSQDPEAASVRAKSQVKELLVQKSTCSQTRGMFLKLAVVLAMATQDSDLIQNAFAAMLSRILRDYEARKECISNVFASEEITNTLATRMWRAGHVCLRLLLDFAQKREKEPDFEGISELQEYRWFASKILAERARGFLEGRGTDVDESLTDATAVWSSLVCMVGQDSREASDDEEDSSVMDCPSVITPRWAALGQWIDALVNHTSETQWDILPWRWSTEELAGSLLAEIAPGYVARLRAAVWNQASVGRAEAMQFWFNAGGGSILDLQELWDSGRQDCRYLVVTYLDARRKIRCQRWVRAGYEWTTRKTRLSAALSWDVGRAHLMRELFYLRPIGLEALLKQGGQGKRQEAKDRALAFWSRLGLHPSASADVHREVVAHDVDGEALRAALRWGSVCPMTAAVSAKTIRLLATSSNPCVVMDSVMEVLKDPESSTRHRHVALNPGTFQRLSQVSTRRWMRRAKETAFEVGKPKITTAKALIQAAASCAAVSVEEQIAMAREVEQSVAHIDVQICFAQMLLDHFWTNRCTTATLTLLSEYAATADQRGMQDTCLARPHNALSFQPMEKILQYLECIVTPTLSAAWSTDKQELVRVLTENNVSATEEEIGLYALPLSLLLPSGWQPDWSLLMAAAFEYQHKQPMAVNVLEQGLAGALDTHPQMATALSQVSQSVRQQVRLLQSAWDWSTKNVQHKNLDWSAVLEVLFERDWTAGFERALSTMARLATRRNIAKEVAKELTTFAIKHKGPTRQLAVKTVRDLVQQARRSPCPEQYALEWVAIAATAGQRDQMATEQEKLAAITELLQRVYESSGGYICARELIDCAQPFPNADSFVVREIAQHAAAALDGDYGCFCLHQILKWIDGSSAMGKVLDDLMKGEIGGDPRWKRILNMRYKWDAGKKQWVWKLAGRGAIACGW